MNDDRGGRATVSSTALLRAQDRVARLYLEKLDAEQASARLQARVELLESSMAFRLGNTLIAAFRSPRGVLALPGVVRAMFRDLRSRAPETNRARAAEHVMRSADLDDVLGEPAGGNAAEIPAQLGDLRIAAVLDEFTAASFMPDCQLLNLPSTDFESSLDEFRPHFLFVESAWRGGDGDWTHRVHPMSGNLMHLIGCCRRRGIPTVFWNKEDPSHFDNFIGAARLFDHVFTTDANCVPKYRETLRHDRIHVLPFGCQPRIHNPIESGDRRRAASFAGSWYRRYPERSRDFECLVDKVSRVMPVDIYDRNAGRGDPNFDFPARFASMIRGHLPYAQIAKAYKGYEVGITINTIKQSPSMCARRVYELLACNTIVASNAAYGMRNMFGDLVLHDDAPDFMERLSDIHSSKNAQHRLRLRGLREVLENHTVAHRLAAVATRVFGSCYSVSVPRVVVLARARSIGQAQMLIAMYKRQHWPSKGLQLVVPATGRGYEEMNGHDDVVLVPETDASSRSPAELWPDAWVAMFHPEDHYGAHYLTDLALATRYSAGQPIGKGQTFVWNYEHGSALTEGRLYRESDLHLRSSLMASSTLTGGSVQHWLGRMESMEGTSLKGLATDEFNYCRGGAGQNAESVEE